MQSSKYTQYFKCDHEGVFFFLLLKRVLNFRILQEHECLIESGFHSFLLTVTMAYECYWKKVLRPIWIIYPYTMHVYLIFIFHHHHKQQQQQQQQHHNHLQIEA